MSETAVLSISMDPTTNGARASSVREYLTKLLSNLWMYEDGFSGKRPFGNSGWQGEVYVALVKAGVVAGSLDEDGFLEDVDDREADLLIQAAITSLATP